MFYYVSPTKLFVCFLFTRVWLFLTTVPVAPITASDVSRINKIEVRRSWPKVRQFSGMEGLMITMKNLSQIDR